MKDKHAKTNIFIGKATKITLVALPIVILVHYISDMPWTFSISLSVMSCVALMCFAIMIYMHYQDYQEKVEDGTIERNARLGTTLFGKHFRISKLKMMASMFIIMLVITVVMTILGIERDTVIISSLLGFWIWAIVFYYAKQVTETLILVKKEGE